MWSEGREASAVLSARRAGVARLPCLWQSWRAAASATWTVTGSKPCQTARAGWHLSWSRCVADERCMLMLCVQKTSRTQAVLPGCASDCVSAASLAPRNFCQGHRPLVSHMQSYPHVAESCRVCAPVIARAQGGSCCPCSMTERWVMQPTRLAVVTAPPALTLAQPSRRAQERSQPGQSPGCSSPAGQLGSYDIMVSGGPGRALLTCHASVSLCCACTGSRHGWEGSLAPQSVAGRQSRQALPPPDTPRAGSPGGPLHLCSLLVCCFSILSM